MIPVTAKRIVLAAIGVAMGVLAIISLCFTVIRMNASMISDFVGALGGDAATTSALKASVSFFREDGFSLLGGNGLLVSMVEQINREAALGNAAGGQTVTYDSYEWLNIFAQVFNIVLLVCAVAILVLAILWFFFGKKEGGIHAIAICSLVYGVLYMAMGLVYYFILKGAFSDIAAQQDGFLPANTFLTSCFVPLILFVVVEIGYWICSSLIREPVSGARRPEKRTAVIPNASEYNYAAQSDAYQPMKIFPGTETDVIDALAKIKALYDAGVLTEKEFNEQKAVYLSSNVSSAMQEQWMLYQRGIISPDQYQAFMNHFNGWNRGMPGMQNIPPRPGMQNVPPRPGMQNVPPRPGMQNIPPMPGMQNMPPMFGAQNVPPRPGMQNMPPMGDAQNVPPVKANGKPAADKQDAPEK